MNRRGMTLVELLVVLVILVGLMTTVVSTSSGMLDRERLRRTTDGGEAIRESLERYDGLSIVSDMGPILDAGQSEDRNLARLGFLFGRSTPFDVTIELNGAVTTNQQSKLAPAFKTLSIPAIPTNRVCNGGHFLTAANMSTVTNGYSPYVSLGCGWRGPYCTARVQDDSGVLRDGFGGPWECAVTRTNGCTTALLISRGRDRAEDGLNLSVDWPDADQTFAVRPPEQVSLVISDTGPKEYAETVPHYLHVFAFAPVFSVPNTSTETTTVSLGYRYFCATNGTSIAIDSGLSQGVRAVFAFTEAGGEFYAAPPQNLLLRPGTNSLELKLIKKASTSP